MKKRNLVVKLFVCACLVAFSLCVPAIAGAITGELYLGGGMYSADGKDVGSSGSNWWAKARLLPLHLDGVDLGVYGSVAGGQSSSEDAEDPSDQYESSWSRWHAGLSALPYGAWGDGHLDIGYGKHESDGHIRLFQGEQTEDVVAISAGVSLKVNKGRVVPKVDVNADFIFTMNEESKRSWDGNVLEPQVSDHKYYEVSLTPWLYRFSAGGVTVSPGLRAAIGASGDEKFTKYAVAVKVGTDRWSYLEISAGMKLFSGEKEDQIYVNAFVTPVRF